MTELTKVAPDAITEINQDPKDCLNRTATAERYLDIILGQDANVFSINAPWGAGKTFLLNEKYCRYNG